MSFVFNAIGDVFEFVIGAVEDVVSFAVEEIIEPVWKATGDVIEAVMDDPIATIASIAATVSGQLYLLPIINAADTLAKGGNFGDVLKGIALNWIAPKFGEYVSGAVTDMLGNDVFSSFAGSVASGAARGGDLRSAILGSVSSEIASAATNVIKTNLPSVDLGDFTFDENTEKALNKGIKTFIDTGGKFEEAAFVATTATISGFIRENSNFDGNITDGLVNATIAGLRGGDILGAFNSTLQAAGTKDLNAKLDQLILPPQTKFYDVNGGEHASADNANIANKEALDGYNTASANYKSAVKAYRSASTSYSQSGREGGGQRKRATADMATANSAMSGAQATMNGYEAAVTDRVDLTLNDAHTEERTVEAQDAASDANIIALADTVTTAKGLIDDYGVATDIIVEKVEDATATAAKAVDSVEIRNLLSTYDGTTAEDFDNLVGELTNTLVGVDGYNPYEGDDGSIEVESNATGEFIQMLFDQEAGEFEGTDSATNAALAEQMESLFATYEGTEAGDFDNLVGEATKFENSFVGEFEGIDVTKVEDADTDAGEFTTAKEDITAITGSDAADTSYLADYQPNQFPEIDRRRLEDLADKLSADGYDVDYGEVDGKGAEELKTFFSDLKYTLYTGTAQATSLSVDGVTRSLNEFSEIFGNDPTGDIQRQINDVWIDSEGKYKDLSYQEKVAKVNEIKEGIEQRQR